MTSTTSRCDGRLERWQLLTGAALLIGYSGYYVCRSNLSVAVPALLADRATGLSRSDLGMIASAGILAYAAGKSITGIAGDFLGGRRLFLGGLFLSVTATLGFAASRTLPLFLACWIANRFVQSAGWGGVTKVAAHWFPAGRYGTIMSFLSLSYLFGDAVGRYALGALLSGGMPWRSLFIAAAAALLAIGVFDMLVLRDSPKDIGCPEPTVSGANLFGAAGAASQPEGLLDLLGPYATSLSFWLICGLSCGLTLIREAFNTWIPAYLVDVHHVTAGMAAQSSALFPLIGGVSAIGIGVLTDRLGGSHRVTLIAPAMLGCAFALVALTLATLREDFVLSMAAIAAIALCLLGPYTLLSGAVAMDLGGRKGSATAAGLIDTAGYAGGTLSGFAVGRLAESAGWSAVFNFLAGIACLMALLAVAHWLFDRRRSLWRIHPQPELT